MRSTGSWVWCTYNLDGSASSMCKLQPKSRDQSFYRILYCSFKGWQLGYSGWQSSCCSAQRSNLYSKAVKIFMRYCKLTLFDNQARCLRALQSYGTHIHWQSSSNFIIEWCCISSFDWFRLLRVSQQALRTWSRSYKLWLNFLYWLDFVSALLR